MDWINKINGYFGAITALASADFLTKLILALSDGHLSAVEMNTLLTMAGANLLEIALLFGAFYLVKKR